MALHADSVWEMRTTGSNTNGGFFYDRDPGTSVDYSQQASAQLSLSDIATDGAGTTLTSATGGFTAAMAGNGIYLTGGGATAGWYEIVTYTDTNTVVIDRSAGASKSGVTGNVGGCVALPVDAVFQALVAGNTLWIKAGTYTLTTYTNLQTNGTTTLPIYFKGYNATRDDAPSGTDRPLVACGAYMIEFGTYWWVSHVRATGTYTQVMRKTGTAILENCGAINTAGGANRSAFSSDNGDRLLCCDGESTNGYAFDLSAPAQVTNCIAQDSAVGYRLAPNNGTLSASVATGCVTGVLVGAVRIQVRKCTIYDCTTGISGTTGTSNAFVDNIIDTCTTGASFSSDYKSDYWDYNNYHGNGTDVSNVTKGANATAYDPDFENAAGGDFRLKAGSSCLTAGMPITLGTGGNSITTHQGAVPPVEGAGGGCVRSPIGATGGLAV